MTQWLETDYFHEFHCKCGDCRHSCCRGWQIDINEREYFRLIGMDCSEKLHHSLECAFAEPEQPTEECFRMIVPNWLGQCPMLDEDGLCALQKECGAEALPRVCRLYPRSLRQEGNVRLACCSGSCEGVVELLMKQDRLQLKNCVTEEEPALSVPARPGFPERCVRCITLLQDRSSSLADRLDAVAAELGCKGSVTGEQVRAALPAFEEISPEIADYLGDEQPGDERVLENLMANHMLYMAFPFADSRIASADAFYGLAALWHLLRMASGNPGERFADAAAAVFHLAEHTAFYYNAWVLLHS